MNIYLDFVISTLLNSFYILTHIIKLHNNYFELVVHFHIDFDVDVDNFAKVFLGIKMRQNQIISLSRVAFLKIVILGN